MLTDLVKPLEVLLNVLKAMNGTDAKRQNLARELLAVYLDLVTVVDRGRTILALANDHCASGKISIPCYMNS